MDPVNSYSSQNFFPIYEKNLLDETNIIGNNNWTSSQINDCNDMLESITNKKASLIFLA